MLVVKVMRLSFLLLVVVFFSFPIVAAAISVPVMLGGYFEYQDNSVKFTDISRSLITLSFKTLQSKVTAGQDPDGLMKGGGTTPGVGGGRGGPPRAEEEGRTTPQISRGSSSGGSFPAAAGADIQRVSYMIEDEPAWQGYREGTLTFRCGRKPSNEVATWFNERISPSQTTFDHPPGKLSFAVIGNLSLKVKLAGDGYPTPPVGQAGGMTQTYTFPDVVLAQGRAGGNNWWFGGTSCTNLGGGLKQVNCTGYSPLGTAATFTFRRGATLNSWWNGVEVLSHWAPEFPSLPNRRSFEGESQGCTWQAEYIKEQRRTRRRNHQNTEGGSSSSSSSGGNGLGIVSCPPYVYYSPQPRAIRSATEEHPLRLFFEGERVTTTASSMRSVDDVGGAGDGSVFLGDPLETQYADESHSGRAAIFVMDLQGHLYASTAHKIGMFHHSSILAGAPVAFAGEITTTQSTNPLDTTSTSKIVRITSCSGHYEVPAAAVQSLKEGLSRQGWPVVTRFDELYQGCSPEALKHFDLNYNMLPPP